MSEELSPIDLIGIELLKRIYQRSVKEGAMTVEVMGPPGSGKTSFCLDMYHNIVSRKNPYEICFMRDYIGGAVQFNRVPNWQIFAEDGMDLRFRDILTNDFFDLPVIYFDSFDDIYYNAKPGYLNAVYFKDETIGWLDFSKYIRRNMHMSGNKYLMDSDYSGPVWRSLFWTEYQDLWGANEPNPQWSYNKEMSLEIKNFRRNYVSCFADTHKRDDVDHRVRGKMMMKGYLRGATVDSHSPITQRAVNSLDSFNGKRQILLDWDAHYGKIRFSGYPPKRLFEVIV